MAQIAMTAECVVSLAILVGTVSSREHRSPTASDDADAGSVLTADAIPCAASSLYILARLEQKPISLNALTETLEGDENAAVSMLLVQQIAHNFGLRLTARRITAAEWPIDSPILLHLALEPTGHYVVIRPVGHSGRLVQVIDGTNGVTVYDFKELASKPEWTGLALLPERTN